MLGRQLGRETRLELLLWSPPRGFIIDVVAQTGVPADQSRISLSEFGRRELLQDLQQMVSSAW